MMMMKAAEAIVVGEVAVRSHPNQIGTQEYRMQVQILTEALFLMKLSIIIIIIIIFMIMIIIVDPIYQPLHSGRI